MWENAPNLRHLRAFAAVVRLGGATRAAAQVHLSQPAITQALAKLEARLDAKLVVASANGMTPTEIGRLFHDRVERALELIATGAREAMRAEARRANAGFAHFEQLITVAQLRALAAMQFNRNFSLAARELNISQPSLHRAARDLERIMGRTLFITTRQGVEMTQTAAAFARFAALAHAELLQGFAEVAEALDRDPGLIVVGSMPFAQTRLLPEALNRLSRERPLARVKVITAPYDGLLGRLRHGVIDFLVGALRSPPPIDDIAQEPLIDDSLAVIGRHGHPLSKRGRVSHDDLLKFPWIAPAEDTPASAVFRNLFSAGDQARMPAAIFETGSLVLARGLLIGSDRLTLLSARQAAHELALDQFALIAFAVPMGARQIGLTFRKGWRPTATQRALIEFLRASGEPAAVAASPPG